MGSLDEEIDALAVDIEKKIIEVRETIADLPEFAPRNPVGGQADKMKKAFDG